jgi:hypothetical protein
VNQLPIEPYFNSGLVAVRPQARIFRSALANLQKFGISPHKKLSRASEPTAYFLEQATLSALIVNRCGKRGTKILSAAYNYHLTSHRFIPEPFQMNSLASIVHMHYHHAFDKDGRVLKAFSDDSRRRSWLQRLVPPQ